jgi:hypothetical protein
MNSFVSGPGVENIDPSDGDHLDMLIDCARHQAASVTISGLR